MKKISSLIIVTVLALTAYAVPAKREWQTRTQADGTTIEVQLVGDEFYHYLINRDGQQVRLNKAGNYEVIGNAPTAQQFRARRANTQRARVHKAKQEFGVTPNLAPRGIVIMVNYANKTFKPANTQAVIDSLCNALNCTVNKNGSASYPSAGQYFADQSNGAYRPVFDVYGPYPLSQNYEYYGEDEQVWDEEEGEYVDGNDIRPANMVVEACKLADSAGVDFTKYDSDGDGKIDFVYVIYAGKGEASGGDANTIWPHSYSIEEQLELEEYFTAYPDDYYDWYGTDFIPYFTQEYQESDCYVDGKKINTYACSNELYGSSLDGIGTLCHEFSHVMGLPDFYETSYGVNSQLELTPGVWNIMDAGSYNGNGHCPPNYDAWEKYFFGWHTPINLGKNSTEVQLIANGQTGYHAYQITPGHELVGPTDSLPDNAPVYYIENRQQMGWDSELPATGMLIWKVQYSKTAWKNNGPNNEDRKPRFTLVIPSGTTIGEYYAEKNVWPYNSKTSWEAGNGKSLTDITRSGNIVTLNYVYESQAIDNIATDQAAVKVLRDGQILILRGDAIYSPTGTRVQ